MAEGKVLPLKGKTDSDLVSQGPLGNDDARPFDTAPPVSGRQPRKAQPKPKPRLSFQTVAERALSLGAKVTRLPCCFETLNGFTRGGFRTGKVVILTGGPGACKTGVMTQMALNYAKQGHHVAIFACDEDANGILIRIGQQLGLNRDALEDSDHPDHDLAVKALAEAVAPMHLMLVDSRETPDATIEAVSEELSIRANGNPSVFCFDSVQAVPSSDISAALPERERLEALSKLILSLTKRHGHLTIATSEANRSAYRSRKERTEGIASAKGASGIEFNADTLLCLNTVPDQPLAVDVEISKNRSGEGKGSMFRLLRSPERASFCETEIPEDERPMTDAEASARRQSAKERARELAVEETKRRILEVLQASPKAYTSMGSVYGAVRGNKDTFNHAFEQLKAKLRIRKYAGFFEVVPSLDQFSEGEEA